VNLRINMPRPADCAVTRWPISFVSKSGQTISLPVWRGFGNFYSRNIMVEYVDYEGNMGHSDWFTY
jgi:hypothetical protein